MSNGSIDSSIKRKYTWINISSMLLIRKMQIKNSDNIFYISDWQQLEKMKYMV